MNTVYIQYMNGSSSVHPCQSYLDARDYCRNISYTGGRVKRVEIGMEGGGFQAIWDTTWDEISKHEGLNR